MFTSGFGMFAIRIINSSQFDAIQGNISGEMCFVENLTGPMQPTRNGLMFIVLFSFRDEMISNSLSILFSDFCEK